MPKIFNDKIIDTSFFLEGSEALEVTTKNLKAKYNEADFVDNTDEIKNLKNKIGFKS